MSKYPPVSNEIRSMIKVEVAKHFASRPHFVFGLAPHLIRIEESADGYFKLYRGRNDYKLCSGIDDLMMELEKLFDERNEDETTDNS